VIEEKVVGSLAWKKHARSFGSKVRKREKESHRPEEIAGIRQDNNVLYQREHLHSGINPEWREHSWGKTRDPPETGALLRAPKKAPPCSTDTTFAETLSIRLCSAGPSAGRTPNLIWKNFDWTMPPATPLREK